MKPSSALSEHADQVHVVLARFGLSNPRIFGSTARLEDSETSDLDVLVDPSPDTSLFDLAGAETELEALLGCKVDVVTKRFLAPDIAERAEADAVPVP
jgi:predicted nucleotidyltransferase